MKEKKSTHQRLHVKEFIKNVLSRWLNTLLILLGEEKVIFISRDREACGWIKGFYDENVSWAF